MMAVHTVYIGIDSILDPDLNLCSSSWSQPRNKWSMQNPVSLEWMDKWVWVINVWIWRSPLLQCQTLLSITAPCSPQWQDALYYCALQPTVTGNTSSLYKNLKKEKEHICLLSFVIDSCLFAEWADYIDLADWNFQNAWVLSIDKNKK